MPQGDCTLLLVIKLKWQFCLVASPIAVRAAILVPMLLRPRVIDPEADHARETDQQGQRGANLWRKRLFHCVFPFDNLETSAE